MRRRTVLTAAAVLAVFVVWTAATSRPVFVTYHSKYSIFSRNYARYGLTGTRLLSYYNFELTAPPSTPYVSYPPLVPLIMYGAFLLGNDRPAAYYAVIIVLHLVAFVLLAQLVRRRWGDVPALWTLVVAVFSRYALTYGDQQTPELVGIIGGFAAVFLYFEWIETGKRHLLALCALAYLGGLAGDYRTTLTGVVIWAHWLLFVPGKTTRDWLRMLLLPLATIAFSTLMLFLMWQARVRLDLLMRRAEARSSRDLGEVLWAFAAYPLILFGPVMVAASLGFVGFLLFRRLTRSDHGEDRTLQLLVSLAVPAIVSIALFGQGYVIHPFTVVSLLPSCAVAAALGITRVTSGWGSPRLQRLCAALLAGAALASALHANQRIPMLKQRLGSFEETPGRYERILALARSVKGGLREGDRLLILGAQGSTSLDKVTAFHELWIPSVDGGKPERWDGWMATGKYRLVLATDTASYEWLTARPDVRSLVADGPIAFFEAPVSPPVADKPRRPRRRGGASPASSR